MKIINEQQFKENRMKVMKDNGLFDKYDEQILYTETKLTKELTPISFHMDEIHMLNPTPTAAFRCF